MESNLTEFLGDGLFPVQHTIIQLSGPGLRLDSDITTEL